MKNTTLETKARTYLKGSFLDYWDAVKTTKNEEVIQYLFTIYSNQKDLFLAIFPKINMERLETRWQNDYKKMGE